MLLLLSAWQPFLWQQHPPAAASAAQHHTSENCTSSATWAEIFPGFACLQQAATDASAFSTQPPRHLPNTSGICILSCSVSAGLGPLLGAWATPFQMLHTICTEKTQTIEQKKAELRQDRHCTLRLTRDPVLSYVLLASCSTDSTLMHVARKSPQTSETDITAASKVTFLTPSRTEEQGTKPDIKTPKE